MYILDLEEVVGYSFRDKTLLLAALTHPSYLHENMRCSHDHNQRLEFMGDAVLELIVTEYLFHQCPKAEEGALTVMRRNVVKNETLAAVIAEKGINRFLKTSKGGSHLISKNTGKAWADVYEAIVGAIYLDRDFEAAEKYVAATLFDYLHRHPHLLVLSDAKSSLQEIVQARLGVTPTYKEVGRSGPDHATIFRIGVYFGDELIAVGEGLSKKQAEQEAAHKAKKSL